MKSFGKGIRFRHHCYDQCSRRLRLCIQKDRCRTNRGTRSNFRRTSQARNAQASFCSPKLKIKKASGQNTARFFHLSEETFVPFFLPSHAE